MYALWAAGTSLLWGLSNVLDKLGLTGCDTPLMGFAVIGIVYGAVATCALAYVGPASIAAFARSSPRSFSTLVVSGVIASIGTYMFVHALDCTHKTHLVSAIAYTAPVFTLVMVKAMDKQAPVRPVHIMAVGLTVGGVALALFS